MKNSVVKIGYVYESNQNGMVLDAEGICPCLGCGAHGGVEPKIRTIEET